MRYLALPALLLVAACTGEQPAQNIKYQCGSSRSVEVSADGSMATLHGVTGDYELASAPTDVGAKYVKSGSPSLLFVKEENGASLYVGKTAYSCQ